MELSGEGRLRELLEELVETLRVSPDPFKIRVRELLDELASLLPSLKLEDLPLDAEILYRLAEVVKKQWEWLSNEAATLALGRLIAAIKVQALSEKELATLLLQAWKPIVELEQVTFTDILRSIEYMGGRRPRVSFEEGGGEVTFIDIGKAFELGVLSSIELEKVVSRVRERTLKLVESEGVAKYSDVVKGSDAYETYLNAYALSLLSTTGEFDVVYDPLKGEFYVTRVSSSGGVESVVISLREVIQGAG
ncbi:MAG: hypothetical protein NZ954_07660 [Thermofilaceae archaeon]|nr:hypothetical protein [Thermofilaceae archaeon]MDW8004722.1 hypothetical protein [Thermofilaceae archaeon]